MIFSDLEFLFLYLPAALAIYYITPRKFKNISLLLASLVFFAWSSPVYLILMVFTVMINYIFGLCISKSNAKTAGIFLAAAVFLNLSFLIFFRYAGFFIKSPNIYPPLGMSFYTLQSISYIFDIYNGGAKPQKNIAALGAYIAMFPKLAAGPIVKYFDIEAQLSHRKESVPMFACGVRTFICGLCKKVFFADTAGAVFTYIKALPEGDITVFGAWFGLVLFGIYIYFELSGYSDMAIGLGKMFGFEFPENFNYPYASKSVLEFFQKWHISLFDWFRQYVYALCKNKKGLRRYVTMAVLCFLIGFWHGAYLNYIILGAYFGIVLILEKRFVSDILKKVPGFIGHIYSLAAVLFGCLIFAFEDMQKGFSYLGKLFGFSVSGFIDGGAVYDLLRYLPFLILAVFGCTPLPKRLYHKFRYFRRTDKCQTK